MIKNYGQQNLTKLDLNKFSFLKKKKLLLMESFV